MSSSRKITDKLLAALQEQSPTDALGLAAAAIGIMLVASGIFLQESGVVFGATIRTLGGVLLLGGLGAVLFVESRRRAAVIGAARRIVERYMAATVTWHWPSRMGLAGVAIGVILLAPALVLQTIFGAGGAIVIAPGIVLFWAGGALLVYGCFHRRNAAVKPNQSSKVSPSQRGGRGNRR